MVALSLVGVAGAAPAGQAGPTLNLIAGQGEGVIGMEGFIADLGLGGTGARVAVGTTVTWTIGSDEAHTISFLGGRPRPHGFVPQPEDPAGLPPMANPDVFFPSPAVAPWDGTTYVNSSPIGRGQDFSVTFGKPGRYDYVCLFHPPMTGFVEVVEAGTAGITTQGAVDGLAAAHMAAIHEAQIAQIYAERNQASSARGPGGTSIWSVRAGTDWRWGHLDIVAFLPDSLTVQRGDTVGWVVDHGFPHTITFRAAGETIGPDVLVIQLPDGTILSPGEVGPPDPHHEGPPIDPSLIRLVLGPGAALSQPGPLYDGVSLYNSGLIGYEGNDALPTGASWALTFDTPGEYEYVCLLHEAQGMVGTITVE